ncbi:MAG: hypothetical protein RLZZ272_1464 [Actinomycetota bacterium]|jgi:hypothetical protein
MPTHAPRVGPQCGIVALGHDGDVRLALGVDVPTSASALPIEELHREIGTRLVVVADGLPRVVFCHDPERVVEEWERCQRDGLVATHNLRSSHLRFPQPWIGSTLLIGVSDAPVRCVLADAADTEAFALLAKQLHPEAAVTDPVIGPGADRPRDRSFDDEVSERLRAADRDEALGEGGVAPTT